MNLLITGYSEEQIHEIEELRKDINIEFPYIVKKNDCAYCAVDDYTLYFYSKDYTDTVDEVFHKHLQEVEDKFIQSFKFCSMASVGGAKCGCGYTTISHNYTYF